MNTKQIITLVLNLGGNVPLTVTQIADKIDCNPEIKAQWQTTSKNTNKAVDTAIRSKEFVKDNNADGKVVWSLLEGETDTTPIVAEKDAAPVVTEVVEVPTAEPAVGVNRRVFDDEPFEKFSAQNVIDYADRKSIGELKSIKVVGGQIILVEKDGSEYETKIDGSELEADDLEVLFEDVSATLDYLNDSIENGVDAGYAEAA